MKALNYNQNEPTGALNIVNDIVDLSLIDEKRLAD
ncbi:MAG: hypothetical protein ACI9VT_004057 [Psychroserpens sp.]|jgi:hypothetical protein